MDFEEIFENKTVLVTGGTGYLGRALLNKLIHYNTKKIKLFSRDEVKHYKIQEEYHNDPKIQLIIGDVRDYSRILKAMDDVDIVIHAAALKRLDILEYNVEESIKTNILGTMNVVNACLEKNVSKAVMISTDKACAPVNTYGACKFISERIFVEANFNKGLRKTIFTTVRYGNVLESTGSVIPFFESKIQKNETIPLTDPKMTRFIISPEQAVELIFKALKFGVGGEVFIPKLPAFKITDLIDILKEKHSSNVGVVIVGLRPGEKINELMINISEINRTYDFNDLYVITSAIMNYSQLDKKPAYYNEEKKLNQKIMAEYSSEHAVISKEDLNRLFKKLKLI